MKFIAGGKTRQEKKYKFRYSSAAHMSIDRHTK